MSKKKPRTSRKGGLARRMAVFVLIICTGTASVLCALAFKELNERRAGNSYYSDLAGSMRRTATAKATARPTAKQEDTSSTSQPEDAAVSDNTSSQTQTQQGASATAETEHAVDIQGQGDENTQTFDFDLLRESMPDVVGWITIEGTQIDYPIVQGEDNDYYLHHLPDGERNAAGSIMMDCACDGVFGNELNIIHGHHMKNDSMFGSLDCYKEKAYYLKHPTIQLYTPDGDFDVAIFAACTLDGEAFGYPTEFSSDSAFEKFIDKCRSRSAFTTDIDVSCGDRLLLLSTCSYSYETERMIVLGKIIEN